MGDDSRHELEVTVVVESYMHGEGFRSLSPRFSGT